MQPSSTSRPSGFTLVELLVVISIVTILFSVLLPALAGARSVARQIVCGTNQRQIGLGAFAYAVDHKERLAGGGYHQYDNLIGQDNRGNVFSFIRTYLEVSVEPTWSPTSSPIPPRGGSSYRIPDRNNVMFCPSNAENLPEDAFPFGSQWRPDYMLRGFGTLNASSSGGFSATLGFPRLDAMGLGLGGSKINLLQDMIYLPGTPSSFPEYERRFTNHWSAGEAAGGSVTASDGSVVWVPAEDFGNPLDSNRVATPLGYVSAYWGFPRDESNPAFAGKVTAAMGDGSLALSAEAFRGLGY